MIRIDYVLSQENVPVTGERVTNYMLVKLFPEACAEAYSLPLNISLVIDNSGSMYGDDNRIAHAIETASHLVDALGPRDTVSVVGFHSRAKTFQTSTPVEAKSRIKQVIRSITSWESGGTRMAEGMKNACAEIHRSLSSDRVNQVLLLTDGETRSESECERIAKVEGKNGIAFSTFGVGDEWNRPLLERIASLSGGDWYYIDHPQDTAAEFKKEALGLQQTVLNTVVLQTVLRRGVKVRKARKVEPSIADLVVERVRDGELAVKIGAMQRNKPVFLLFQLSLPANEPRRYRIADLFAMYDSPASAGGRGSTEKVRVITKYTTDPSQINQNGEVLRYVDAEHVDVTVKKATRLAEQGKKDKATRLLSAARQVSERTGDRKKTQLIEDALRELGASGKIDRKTQLAMEDQARKTQLMSEDEIEVTIGDNAETVAMGKETKQTEDGLFAVPNPTRYSDVSFPSHTIVQQTEALRVAIALEPISNQSAELALEVPSDDEEPIKVDACLAVSPQSFDLKSPSVQTIEVPFDEDSAPVIFKLVPKSVGRKTIGVEFFQDTRYLGRAEVQTTVEEKLRESHPVSAHVALALRPQQLAPDLTIYIEEISLEKERRLYHFLLLSPIHELNLSFEEAGEVELQAPPEVYFEGLFAEMNDWLGEPDVDDDLFFKRLSSLGANLYDQLFPEKLKRIYWEKLRDEVGTVQIISADPWIPWELVRPYHPETLGEDSFLCEQFALTRWLAGPSSPDVIDLQRMALVVAASDLSAAADEAAALRRLPGVEVKDVSPSLLDIYGLLEKGGFQGLHFACHGEYDRQNPDQSVVLLEAGQRFRPNDIAGKKRTFGHDEPLVFLNACETGRAGLSLTGLGGWAKAFIGAGAGGFVGSTWEAHDESAYNFAVAFYGYLLGGETVAEAARLARREIRRAGDPTWLSYTVYANPLARLAARTDQGKDLNSQANTDSR